MAATIDARTDRIEQLEANIACLYSEVERIEGRCDSMIHDKASNRYFLLDLQCKGLREKARVLDAELGKLLEVESRLQQ